MLVKSIERKKKHSEVFTPDYLCDEMVNKLKINWKDINLKILEPSCGNGQIVIKLIDKLLQFHNIDYILSDILYAFDIQEDNISEMIKRIENKYNITIKKHNFEVCDALTTEIPSEFFTSKYPLFDLVISNPPYNVGTVKKNHYVYDKIGKGKIGTTGFMYHYNYFLKEDGISCWLAPLQWVSSPNNKEFRINLQKTSSIIDIWTYKKPVVWKSVLIVSTLAITVVQKRVGLPYNVNYLKIGYCMGSNNIFIVPKNNVELSIWNKISKCNQNIKDISESVHGHGLTTDKGYRPNNTEEHMYSKNIKTKGYVKNFTQGPMMKDISTLDMSIKNHYDKDAKTDEYNNLCINGLDKDGNYRYGWCRHDHLQDLKQDKIGFMRIISKKRLFGYKVPMGIYAANTDFLYGDSDIILHYFNTKLFFILYQIISPSRYVNKVIEDTPIWQYKTNPYDLLTKEEIDYIENELWEF